MPQSRTHWSGFSVCFGPCGAFSLPHPHCSAHKPTALLGLGILHGSWQPQMKAHVFICINPNHISFLAQLQLRQVGLPLRPSWFCPDLSSALLSSTGTTPKNPRNCHCSSLRLVTHFPKCPETLQSGGWRCCFSPFPCKSPVSRMWPWQLPSNSLDVSIFSYSSHLPGLCSFAWTAQLPT